MAARIERVIVTLEEKRVSEELYTTIDERALGRALEGDAAPLRSWLRRHHYLSTANRDLAHLGWWLPREVIAEHIAGARVNMDAELVVALQTAITAIALMARIARIAGLTESAEELYNGARAIYEAAGRRDAAVPLLVLEATI